MSLSVGGSLLDSASSKAATAAMDEMGLLTGVRTEIWYIKDELRTMKAFLRAAEKRKDGDELVKVWAEQVEELSYDIKYCLDGFKVNLGHQGCLQQLTTLRDRHQIGVQIRRLKARVEEVSSRIQRYSHLVEPITSNSMNERETYMPITSNSMNERETYMEDIPNLSASFDYDEVELVGVSRPRQELLELIDVCNMDGLAQVVCVVGMCGVGKTTLVRMIYDSKEDIVKKFSCCAWITVSQTFCQIGMLKDMIMQLLGYQALLAHLSELEGKTVGVDDLASYLRKKLEDKRYFIVLDDVWAVNAWRWIKDIAFPSSNNKGSRIIIITRDVGLARECTFEPLIYPHEPLQTEDAMNLLLRNIRKIQVKHDENMRHFATKIVDRCGCLPLALLVIGGVLATKHVFEWENIYNQLPQELKINPSLKALRMIVKIGYNQLSPHLKPCFLYLCIFPKGFVIQMRRLIDRWIVEGFVTSRIGMDIEEVAKSYFHELLRRGMIQPSRVNVEGSVRSCQVHDVMHDIMVSVCRDENFAYLRGDIVTNTPEENFRHLAHHGCKCPKIDMDWSHVRSFTLFGVCPVEPALLCSPYLRMLRVLDLQDAQFSITQKDMNNIGLLHRLKYVNVRGHSNICALPGSVGKLYGLQYLDIRNSCITALPTEIGKLHGLYSLRCSRETSYSSFDQDGLKKRLMHKLCLPKLCTNQYESEGVRVPSGIGNLKELHTLEVVDIKRTGRRAVKELGELMQLRKLSVTTIGASEQKCKILCAAIQKLPSLSSLYVYGTDNNMADTLEWLRSIYSAPPLMRSLKLWGCLREMPDWVGSLMHLMKIHLWGSRLEEGKSMEILGALANLMIFRLSRESYIGEKLVFGAGAFPNLRKLDIYHLEQLREVEFEEGASPRMERIEIAWCELESGIIGIRHLPRLKEISLGHWGRVAKLGVLQGEVDAHPNHPLLRLARDRSHHDLGGIVEGSNDVEEEAREESCIAEAASAGESSQPQVAVQTTSDKRQDHHLLYTYNSC